MKFSEVCRRLEAAQIEDSGREAALLISHYCGVTTEDIMADRGREYSQDALIRAVEKRTARFPLQYILGEWYFCNESYEVSPDCLIPRPETELLVVKAAALLPQNSTFLDLCTGSGCIAISLLAMRKDCRAVAVDLFDKTLALAARNAERNGVVDRVRFVKCDVLSHDAPEIICGNEKFAALLSNPPYIKSADIPKLEPELAYEPSAALDGGGDGLDFYRSIIPSFSGSLTDGGFMLFETGNDTASGTAALGAKQGFNSEIIKDYSGLERMVLLK